jgi:orotate phosphoribosyltransferase
MDHRSDSTGLRSELFELIKARAFRRGRIRLASGKESDFYFDMKMAMLDPEGARLVAELMHETLRDVEADAVGGLEMGAVPLITPVSIRSLERSRPLSGFVIRKTLKDHGTQKRVEGPDIAGKKVVILEDVTTTGGSALDAASAAREAGAEIVLILSILDRGEGAGELYASAGIPFRSLFKAEEFLAA